MIKVGTRRFAKGVQELWKLTFSNERIFPLDYSFVAPPTIATSIIYVTLNYDDFFRFGDSKSIMLCKKVRHLQKNISFISGIVMVQNFATYILLWNKHTN
jgi:hypothetical protein